MVIILILLPLLLSAYLALHLILGYNSKKWPNTTGSVIYFNVDTRKIYSKFPSITGIDHICIVKVKYEYRVNGKKYTSNRIQFGKDMSYKDEDELNSDELIKQIRSNNFKVYYFEQFPRFAVLQPGIKNEMEHVYGIIFILSVPVLLYIFYLMVTKMIH